MSELAVRGQEQRATQRAPTRCPLCVSVHRDTAAVDAHTQRAARQLCVKHRRSWQRSVERAARERYARGEE